MKKERKFVAIIYGERYPLARVENFESKTEKEVLKEVRRRAEENEMTRLATKKQITLTDETDSSYYKRFKY